MKKAMKDVTDLINFLHTWSSHSTIYNINILPRTTRVRNEVINHMNNFLSDLSNRLPYVTYIDTVFCRSLFSTYQGFKLNEYFKLGSDNVHLNQSGVVKLGRHLKFVAHNPPEF